MVAKEGQRTMSRPKSEKTLAEPGQLILFQTKKLSLNLRTHKQYYERNILWEVQKFLTTTIMILENNFQMHV